MTSYWEAEPHNGDVILPSLYFNNANEFFSSVKPPLFEDYEIKIEDDATSKECFGQFAFLGKSLPPTLFLSFLALIFFVY